MKFFSRGPVPGLDHDALHHGAEITPQGRDIGIGRQIARIDGSP